MRQSSIILLAAATLLTACGRLRSEDAEKLLRERHGSGTPVQLHAYAGEFASGIQLAELARLGLIDFTEGEFMKRQRSRLSVRPEGAALGLSLTAGDWLTAKLCDVVFGSIKEFGRTEGDTVQFVQVAYELVHAAHTPLYEKLRGSKALADEQCDPTMVYPQRAQFVRKDHVWRLNQPPKIPAGVRTTVKYEYDRAGNRTGATNELAIEQPLDPDGDPVTVSWSGSVYDDKSLVPMKALKAQGLKATFAGMSGAVVFAVARDPFGGVDSVRFCFESRSFSCSR